MAKQAFGDIDCESEIKKLGADYSELFFSETPFNQDALDPDVYLIIGRRGAGKTALCHYFSFQHDIQNAIYIDVDEPAIYSKVLGKMATFASNEDRHSSAKAIDIWEYLLWNLIISKYKDSQLKLEQLPKDGNRTPTWILYRLIDWLGEKIGMPGGDNHSVDSLSDEGLDGLSMNEDYRSAIEDVLKTAAKRPIFLAVDTLERYNINDTGLMTALAGLVEAAAKFNLEYSRKGIHVKVFMSGEVFPFLTEVALSNSMKYAKQPVHMLWRSKDLLRLIAWRFHQFLKKDEYLAPGPDKKIDWADHKQVIDLAWAPYFGKSVINRNGIPENSFAYVLRHTQMRPRQLILLCNEIARRSRGMGTFPHFSREQVIEGVELGERELAVEILNSYSQIYPGVNEIVRVLLQVDVVFKGNQLAKLAPLSTKYWKTGDYSQANFIRLVTELGIVGKVEREAPGYVVARYSYAQNYQIELTQRDTCAIHPMFFHFLQITQPAKPLIVYPFVVSNDDEKWLGM